MLDDYASLERLLERIPDGADYLGDVGDKFMSVGLCKKAVEAFLKAGDAKRAIDCCSRYCERRSIDFFYFTVHSNRIIHLLLPPLDTLSSTVLLNQWDQAVDLAEQYKFPQIEGLLTKYATHLLQKDQLVQAIERM
jgi:WD repeat-containing protein 35